MPRSVAIPLKYATVVLSRRMVIGCFNFELYGFRTPFIFDEVVLRSHLVTSDSVLIPVEWLSRQIIETWKKNNGT